MIYNYLDSFLYHPIGHIKKHKSQLGEVLLVLQEKWINKKKIDTVYLANFQNFLPYCVNSSLLEGNHLLLWLSGVVTQKEAALLEGCSVFLSKAFYEKILQNEKKEERVFGYAIYEQKSNAFLGKITGVLAGGAQKILEISSEKGDFMLPFHSNFIESISDEKKIVWVHLPDGYLEMVQGS